MPHQNDPTLLSTWLEVRCRCGYVLNIRTQQAVWQRQCRQCQHQIKVYLGQGKRNLRVMYVRDGGFEEAIAYQAISQEGDKL